MAHEITKSDSLMYSGDVPWHKMGKFVGKEPIRASEAIVQAGLNWEVEKLPTHVQIGDTWVKSDSTFHTVRPDTQSILGTVDAQYHVFQNREAFAWLDDVVGASGEIRYHTAGSLRGNRLVWLCGELVNHTFEALKGDEVKQYIVLMTSHDGTMALRAGRTNVRIVCKNTWNAAMADMRDQHVNIRHKSNMQIHVEDAQRVMGLLIGQAGKYQEFVKWLASQKVSDTERENFCATVMPTPEMPAPEVLAKLAKDEANEALEKIVKQVQKVQEQQKDLLLACMSGRGNDGLKGYHGTRWELLNGITEYNTHIRRHRAGKEHDATEGRMLSVWMGEGAKLESEAVRLLANDGPMKLRDKLVLTR